MHWRNAGFAKLHADVRAMRFRISLRSVSFRYSFPESSRGPAPPPIATSRARERGKRERESRHNGVLLLLRININKKQSRVSSPIPLRPSPSPPPPVVHLTARHGRNPFVPVCGARNRRNTGREIVPREKETQDYPSLISFQLYSYRRDML